MSHGQSFLTGLAWAGDGPDKLRDVHQPLPQYCEMACPPPALLMKSWKQPDTLSAIQWSAQRKQKSLGHVSEWKKKNLTSKQCLFCQIFYQSPWEIRSDYACASHVSFAADHSVPKFPKYPNLTFRLLIWNTWDKTYESQTFLQGI